MCLPGTLAACLGSTLRSMPVVEAMPAVTPDTRSKGSVTAETALRLRLANMPGLGAASGSSLKHLLNLICGTLLASSCQTPPCNSHPQWGSLCITIQS